MKKFFVTLGLTTLITFFQGGMAEAEKFTERFGKGRSEFGVQVGFGRSLDHPSFSDEDDRTDLDFLFIFPNYKYNLTGIVGESFYRGSLYWMIEAGGIVSVADPKRFGVKTGESPIYQVGVSPLMVEYKFLSPDRRWAPSIIAGAGFSWGDINDGAAELSTAFEFILNIGAGVEYFRDTNGSWSLNYRIFHLSNAHIKTPNIGLNSHVLSLGFSF